MLTLAYERDVTGSTLTRRPEHGRVTLERAQLNWRVWARDYSPGAGWRVTRVTLDGAEVDAESLEEWLSRLAREME